MSRWYRVFGSLDTVPTDLVAVDDDDWHRAEISTDLVLERFRADEEGIRAELNSWAAFLETCDGPHVFRLMERAIQTKQLFTIHNPTGDGGLDRECNTLCQHLARITEGFYQADGLGFFDADGTLLVEER